MNDHEILSNQFHFYRANCYPKKKQIVTQRNSVFSSLATTYCSQKRTFGAGWQLFTVEPTWLKQKKPKFRVNSRLPCNFDSYILCCSFWSLCFKYSFTCHAVYLSIYKLSLNRRGSLSFFTSIFFTYVPQVDLRYNNVFSNNKRLSKTCQGATVISKNCLTPQFTQTSFV